MIWYNFLNSLLAKQLTKQSISKVFATIIICTNKIINPTKEPMSKEDSCLNLCIITSYKQTSIKVAIRETNKEHPHDKIIIAFIRGDPKLTEGIVTNPLPQKPTFEKKKLI